MRGASPRGTALLSAFQVVLPAAAVFSPPALLRHVAQAQKPAELLVQWHEHAEQRRMSHEKRRPTPAIPRNMSVIHHPVHAICMREGKSVGACTAP